MTIEPSRRLPPRAVFVALARVANAVFFIVTATYCVLTYSSFAFQQFIRPHLVSQLASFVVFHHLWHWVMLGVTALTLLPELKAARGRVMAWAYLAAMTLVGILALVRPILPMIENDALGLRLACGFLVPPIWLAVFDHLATSREIAPAPVDRRRVVFSMVVAAVAVWIMHVAFVPLRLNALGDFTASRSSLVFGIVTSLVVHVGVFAACGLLIVAAMRVARLRVRGWSLGRVEMSPADGLRDYWVIVSIAALGCWLIVAKLVFASLSFRGPAAWLLAAEVAAAMVLTWSGVARRLTLAASAPALGSRLWASSAQSPEPEAQSLKPEAQSLKPRAQSPKPSEASALDVWCSPLPGTSSPRAALFGLGVLPAFAYFAINRVETFDWDFLVQNLCVVVVWLTACALAHALVPAPARIRPRQASPRSIAVAAGVILLLAGVRGHVESGLAAGLTRPTFVPEFVLDAYATLDPSYRLMRYLLRVEPPGSAEFYGYLRANSLIQHVPIAPIDVDFVTPLTKASSKPPNIFLFVIDSLRRDYVSVYNPAVTFTPSFARFAAEGYAFDRSFTRYGGTGLSMPAIWAGGMLVHKEYVLPFQRMNALEKLLTVNGYRSIVSMDHITEQLLTPEDAVAELDHGRDEMQYDLCTTLTELEAKLTASAADPAPVFAHTRSLNLHVSKLTNRSLSLDRAYEGFQGPAAAAVGRMDRCFGGFVDFLKKAGIYDSSVVIVTSDHGDSLGEAKRWGHSYTIFPEIVRTPLLIHLPPGLRSHLTADVQAVTFSTDITPTLYALLGYAPTSPGWAYGSPLFVPAGTDLSWRRRDTFLVASSYGPVYGLLRNNGRALYIADGVNLRDYAYDISGLRPVRIGVTDDLRSESRAVIREQVSGLAAMYHFTPQN